MRILHSAAALALIVSAVTAQSVPRKAVRICAGGDVSLGTNLDTTWSIGRFADGKKLAALPDPRELLAPLTPLFADANIVLLNVEGAIGKGYAPRKCARRSTQCYALRMQPAAAAAIRRVNDSAIVVGNVSNNHMHDAGPTGLAETERLLEAAGVLATGDDTLGTAVRVSEGDTIAFLGFSPWGVMGLTDLEAVRRHVARAAARFGRVIVTMHIGAEGSAARHTVNRVERFAGENRGNSVAFSRAALDGGASMVIGSGPHVLRAMETIGVALVAHSLGNLVTYGPFNHSGYNDHGAVLCATLAGDGAVSGAVVTSTAQSSPGFVRADTENLGAQDIAELSKQDFPKTGAVISAAGDIKSPRIASPR